MHLRTFLALLFFLGLSMLWLIREEIVERAATQAPPPPKRVEMTGVRVRSYAPDEDRLVVLRGESIQSNVANTELDLEPVEGDVHEDGRVTLSFEAARGSRRTTTAGEYLRFVGDVDARTEDGRSLAGQEVVYFPGTGRVQCPVRATIRTTSSSLTGDRIETTTKLENGLVNGSVAIETTRMASKPGGGAAARTPVASRPVPLLLHGDSASFDSPTGVYELLGHAAALRSDGTLTANRLLYQEETQFLRASGNVRFTDPSYVLSAGLVEYDVGREWVTARQEPRATILAAGATEEVELEAETMSFDRKRERLLAEGEVRARMHPKDRPVYDVTSERCETFYTESRSIFKERVRIRSTEMGADGDRAVFYESSEKVHVIGNAKAWSVEDDGSIRRTLEGNRIIHDTATGKSIALEGVVLRERPRRTLRLK